MPPSSLSPSSSSAISQLCFENKTEDEDDDHVLNASSVKVNNCEVISLIRALPSNRSGMITFKYIDKHGMYRSDCIDFRAKREKTQSRPSLLPIT